METHVRLQQVITSAAFACMNTDLEAGTAVSQANHYLTFTQDYLAATNMAFYDLYSVKSTITATNKEITNLVEQIIKSGKDRKANVIASQILESILNSFAGQRCHAEECKVIPTKYTIDDDTIPAHYYSKSVFSRLPGYAVLSFEPNIRVVISKDGFKAGHWATPVPMDITVEFFIKKFFEMSREPMLGNSRYGLLPFRFYFPEERDTNGPDYLTEFASLVMDIEDLLKWQEALDNPVEVKYDDQMQPIHEVNSIDPQNGYAVSLDFTVARISIFFAALIADYNPYLSATYGVK